MFIVNIKNEQGLGSQIMVIISWSHNLIIALVLGFLSYKAKKMSLKLQTSVSLFLSLLEKMTQCCLSWPASIMHIIGN